MTVHHTHERKGHASGPENGPENGTGTGKRDRYVLQALTEGRAWGRLPTMLRQARNAAGGRIYQVLNRAMKNVPVPFSFPWDDRVVDE